MLVKGDISMSYAYWEKENNIEKNLKKISFEGEIESSGIPVIYDKNGCYITKGIAHSLIVGSTGSGKTQALILPLIRLSLRANESLIVNDNRGDIYERTAADFIKNGYNVIVLDFDKSMYGNSWNPLILPYEEYKNNHKDIASKLLEYLSYYLFNDEKNTNTDPFWIESVCNYFTGLCLYLFDNYSKEEINLTNVFKLSTKVIKDSNFLKTIGEDNIIYYSLSSILEAPEETKLSITTMFNQKMKKYLANENLSNMMLTSDFDISKITTEKTIIYIINGYHNYGNNLTPLFISQVIESTNLLPSHNKKLNIVLDEFDRLLPIKDFQEIINYSRSLNICFTVVIRSYLDLVNTYGKENIELIKMCFANIIYLLSNDIYTLNEISSLCGNKEENNKISPLITVEELKTLKPFEAIYLLIRNMPFKTTLTPDWRLFPNSGTQNLPLPERKNNSYQKIS